MWSLGDGRGGSDSVCVWGGGGGGGGKCVCVLECKHHTGSQGAMVTSIANSKLLRKCMHMYEYTTQSSA